VTVQVLEAGAVLLLASTVLTGCQLPFLTSQAQPLPSCVSPHSAAAQSPDPQAGEAARQYQAFLDRHEQARIQHDQALEAAIRQHDVPAARAIYERRIQAAPGSVAEIKAIPFPNSMADDVRAYLQEFDKLARTMSEYVDALDDRSRTQAIDNGNVEGRRSLNIVNQVRVDLGLQTYPCPYTGP